MSKPEDISQEAWDLAARFMERSYPYGAKEFAARAIMAATEAERASRVNAVGVGMAIAAGIIMSCWGDEVQAEEILGAAGLTTVAAMRGAGVETYDIRLCLPVLRTFRERARAKAYRSKATLTAGEQVGVV